MREIKFLCIGKTNNKFFRETFTLEEIRDGGLDYWQDDIYLLEYKQNNYQQWDVFKLLKFTGLKDKNGVEIYFGDILLEKNSKRPSGISDYHQDKRMIVEDKIHYISFTNINYNKQAEYYGTYHSSYYKYNMDKLEVIGNIYENKELLND
jgi:uncharacterized phage protein (TIGR01671 family)